MSGIAQLAVYSPGGKAYVRFVSGVEALFHGAHTQDLDRLMFPPDAAMVLLVVTTHGVVKGVAFQVCVGLAVAVCRSLKVVMV